MNLDFGSDAGSEPEEQPAAPYQAPQEEAEPPYNRDHDPSLFAVGVHGGRAIGIFGPSAVRVSSGIHSVVSKARWTWTLREGEQSRVGRLGGMKDDIGGLRAYVCVKVVDEHARPPHDSRREALILAELRHPNVSAASERADRSSTEATECPFERARSFPS
jgi:hypothetical protein